MDGTVSVGTHGTVFTGPDGTKLFVAQALISALRLYVKSGLKVNSGWSPMRMLRRASQITGKPYKRTEYHEAISDLKVWINVTLTEVEQ